jgi:prolyl-tRNA synthetase
LLTCSKCNYTANEEKATGVLPDILDRALKAQSTTNPVGDSLLQLLNPSSAHPLEVQFATVKASLVDKHGKRTVLEENALVAAVSSSSREVNFLKVYEVIRQHMESKVTSDQHFVRSEISLTPTVPDTITSSQSVHLIIDESAKKGIQANEDTLQNDMKELSCKNIVVHPKGDYRVAHEGDLCPSCHADNVSSKLITEKAIEIGHTFLLGTKYSNALDCSFTPREPANATKLPAQMGCYGIGVSRLSAAVIESLHDDAGMVWPTSIAPYRACILVADNKNPESNNIAENLYDELNAQTSIHDPLCNEIVLDDRKGGFGFKIRDAEMIGYPFVVIVGNKTRTNGMVEIRERIKGQKSHQIELPIKEAVAHLKQRVAEKLAV